MALDGNFLVNNTDTVIGGTPRLLGECMEGKYSLICMDKLDLIELCLLELGCNSHKNISIVWHCKVDDSLYPLYVFIFNTMLLIDPSYHTCRNLDIRVPSMKHLSTLLKREMCPVL